VLSAGLRHLAHAAARHPLDLSTAFGKFCAITSVSPQGLSPWYLDTARHQHSSRMSAEQGSNAALAQDVDQKLSMQGGSQAAAVADGGAAEVPAAAAADEGPPHPSGLTLEQRFQLCRVVAEECINDAELRNLLKHKPHPVAYDGFEPSGRMHIAQGVMKAINVNRLTQAGCTFKFWVADWFAQLNNKMGGDLKKIQTVGKYMVEVRKQAGFALKMWCPLEPPCSTLPAADCVCLSIRRAINCPPALGAGVEGCRHGSQPR